MTIREMALVVSVSVLPIVRAGAAAPPVAKVFTSGAPARAADVNANFQELADRIQALADRVQPLADGLQPLADRIQQLEVRTQQLTTQAGELATQTARLATQLPLPIPPGTVLSYAGASAPAGFLLCDGAAVSRTTHAALFAAIGTSFGAGDGSTTFNVPDLRGMFVRGAGPPPRPFAASGVNPEGGSRVTVPGHGLVHTGVPIQLRAGSGGSVPAPLATGVTYWAIVVDGDTIQVAATEADALAGKPITLTTQGTGSSNVLVPWVDPDGGARTASAPGGATGAVVGSKQEDAFQNITGELDVRKSGEGVEASTGALAASYTDNISVCGHVDGGTWPCELRALLDASRSPGARTSTETRPRNLALGWIIKL